MGLQASWQVSKNAKRRLIWLLSWVSQNGSEIFSFSKEFYPSIGGIYPSDILAEDVILTIY